MTAPSPDLQEALEWAASFRPITTSSHVMVLADEIYRLRAELASEGERRLELAATLQSDWAEQCAAMAPVVRAAVGLRGVPIRTEKWKVVYPRFLAAIEKFLASGLLPDIELEDSK